MDHTRLTAGTTLRAALIVGSCFLLMSTGWLAWLYNLAGLAPAEDVDGLTLVVGYALQAVGVGVYMLAGRHFGEPRLRRIAVGGPIAYVACLVPAVVARSLAAALAFGYLANVVCGLVMGYYLHVLATAVEQGRRGRAFGCSYAATTVLTWLLSLPANGALARGVPALVVCAVLALLAVPLVATGPSPQGDDADAARMPKDQADKATLLLGCGVVLLASMVKNAGYSFPFVDLGDGVSLEASRLLYGVGLVVAGFVSDKGRLYGALCCMVALVTPFLMLALWGMDAPGTLLWSVDYLLYGFFSVFRALLFVDFASAAHKGHLAGAGMLVGRAGDALGTALCLALVVSPLVLVCVAAAMFALTAAAFFLLYQRLYAPVPNKGRDERLVFEQFCARHDLSVREREVLRLVLAENTNAQIAAQLFVSESTVKFHVRNLLKKTGCKNRVEVLAAYADAQAG